LVLKWKFFGCGPPITNLLQPNPHVIWYSPGIFQNFDQLDGNSNFQFDKCYVGFDGKVFALTSNKHDLRVRNGFFGNWKNVDIYDVEDCK